MSANDDNAAYDTKNQERLAKIKALARSMEGLTKDEFTQRTTELRERLNEDRKQRAAK